MLKISTIFLLEKIIHAFIFQQVKLYFRKFQLSLINYLWLIISDFSGKMLDIKLNMWKFAYSAYGLRSAYELSESSRVSLGHEGLLCLSFHLLKITKLLANPLPVDSKIPEHRGIAFVLPSAIRAMDIVRLASCQNQAPFPRTHF